MGVKGAAAREKLQRELAAGSGQFFVSIGPVHSEENVANVKVGHHPFRNWGYLTSGLPRKVWGLRTKQIAWYDAMVHRSRLQCNGQARLGPRQRPFGLVSGDGVTGLSGQQSM